MFRFTIRDVLWLTAIVAMAAGWVLDRAQLTNDRKQLRAAVEHYEAYGLDRVLKQYAALAAKGVPFTVKLPYVVESPKSSEAATPQAGRHGN